MIGSHLMELDTALNLKWRFSRDSLRVKDKKYNWYHDIAVDDLRMFMWQTFRV